MTLVDDLVVFAYGAAKPTPPTTRRSVFGAGLYGLVYGVLGPALGVTPPLSRDTSSSIVQHRAASCVTPPIRRDHRARRGSRRAPDLTSRGGPHASPRKTARTRLTVTMVGSSR